MNEAALPPCPPRRTECLRLSGDCLLILEGCAFDPPRRSEAQPQQKKSNTDAKLLLGK
jgi:hypothetical protein